MAASWLFCFFTSLFAVWQGWLAAAAGVTDASEHCTYWASAGECEANAEYMLGQCAFSCTRGSVGVEKANGTGAPSEGKIADELDYLRLAKQLPPRVVAVEAANTSHGVVNCSGASGASPCNDVFSDLRSMPMPEHTWGASGTMILTPAIAAGIWFLFRAHCAATSNSSCAATENAVGFDCGDSPYVLTQERWFSDVAAAPAAYDVLPSTRSCEHFDISDVQQQHSAAQIKHLRDQLAASQQESARLQKELDDVNLDKENEIRGLRVQLEMSPWRGAEFARREYLQEVRSAKLDEDESKLREQEQHALEQVDAAQRSAAQHRSENIRLMEEVSKLRAEIAAARSPL